MKLGNQETMSAEGSARYTFRVLPTVVGDGRARPALELNDQDLQAHDHYSNYRDLSNLVKYKSTKRP